VVIIESTFKQSIDGKLEINSFELSQSDTEMVRIKKIRKTTKCYMCKKLLPKGSKCYGERYMKVCIECARDKYLPKIIADIKKLSNGLEEEQANLDLNWGKYQRGDTLANLQHNE